MFNKMRLAVLISVVSFLSVTGLALAQEVPQPAQQNIVTSQKAITIATVNIYDAKIVEQKDNVFKISFDLSNRVGVQPTVKYAVQLIDTHNIVVDEKVYPEVINLGENQTIPKQIEYQAPSYFKGDYKLWLTARNQDGMLLSIVNPGKVTLAGDNQYVALEDCRLRVDAEKANTLYLPFQGVDITSSEKLIAYCRIINYTDKETTVTPNFTTNWRSTFGQPIDTNNVDQSSITLKIGETKQVAIPLPLAQAPQAYDATLILQDAQGKTVSNQVVFHYVVHGLSATIQNLLLDKDYYAQGDIAKVSFSWSASADNFPNSRLGATDNGNMQAVITITNDQGKTCATLQKALDQNSMMVAYDMPILADCPNPQVSASIQDGTGKVLDKNDFSIKSHGISDTNNMVVIILIILLVLIAGIVTFLKYKNKKSITTVVMFILLVGGMSLIGNTKARADTFWAADHNYYTVNLNKASYSPGESATATGSGNWSWCNNTFGSAALNVTINGQNKQIFNLSMGISVNVTYTSTTQEFSSLQDGYGDYVSVRWVDTPTEVGGGDIGSWTIMVPTPIYTYNIFGYLSAESQEKLSQLEGEGYTCSTWAGRYYCILGTAHNSISIPVESTPGNYYALFDGCNGFENGCGLTSPWTSYLISYAVTAPSPSTLTVTKAGTGSGTVSSVPAGINCGSTCSASYNSGTSVTLTAVPSTGSVFAGWSGGGSGWFGGGGCSGTSTCTVAMSTGKAVTATFTLTAAPAVNGVCGGANGKVYPYSATGYGSDVQCSSAASSNTTFPAAGSSAAWLCWGTDGQGTGGGNPATCGASHAAAPVAVSCGTNAKTYTTEIAWPSTAVGSFCSSGGPMQMSSGSCTNIRGNRYCDDGEDYVYCDSATTQTDCLNILGTWNSTPRAVSAPNPTFPAASSPANWQCGSSAPLTPCTALHTTPNSCTGLPTFGADAYTAPDNTGLTANTQYSYSSTDTATKCQYKCSVGYVVDSRRGSWGQTIYSCIYGSLTVSSASCVITSGSTCPVYATWNTINATDPKLVNGNTGGVLSTDASKSFSFWYGPGLQVWVTYPQTVFYLKNGTTYLNSKLVIASYATPPPLSGSCSAVHYTCSPATNTSINQISSPSMWTWVCPGSNGGASPTCSEKKSPGYIEK